MDEDLRRELLARRDEDQRIRTLVSPPRGQHTIRLPDEVAAQWWRIDEDNTRWLSDLVEARGWPGRTVAGQDGAGAAWLLAQHADRDPVRQRAFLDGLRGAVERGEASRAHLAYLEDRVRGQRRPAAAVRHPVHRQRGRTRAVRDRGPGTAG